MTAPSAGQPSAEAVRGILSRAEQVKGAWASGDACAEGMAFTALECVADLCRALLPPSGGPPKEGE